MTLLIIAIIIALLWFKKRIGFNFGSIIGSLIGVIIGSNLGITENGEATNGYIIFGAIGFIMGGFIFKNLMKKK